MKNQCSGMTLVELIVTVAIASIALGIGIPAFAALGQRMAISTDANALTVTLAKARLSAITRRHPVTACPSLDGTTCRTDLTWDGGWIIYDDPDRQPQPAAPEDIIWRQQASHPSLAIRTTIGRHRVRYQPNGMAGGSDLTLTLCARRNSKIVGYVFVNLAGRIRQGLPATDTPCPFNLNAGA